MVRLGIATVFLLTMVGLAPVPAWAGETDSTTFRIQDYIPVKFTDFGWRLDGGARLKRNESATNTDYDDGSNVRSIDRDNGYRLGSLDFGSAWRYQYETKQGLFDLGFTSDFDLDDRNDAYSEETELRTGVDRYSKDESKRREGIATLGFDSETRRFLYRDVFLGGVLAWKYRYTDEQIDYEENRTYGWYEPSSNSEFIREELSSTRRHNVRKDFTLAGELQFGWGRVYEGRHTATALYMLDELASHGLMVGMPSTEDGVSMAEMVHHYRMQHAVDSREHRAMALRALLEFLQSRGAIDSVSDAPLLVIEDVWDYYPTDRRRFGYAVSIGFGGQDRYESIHYGTDTESRTIERRTYRDSAATEDTLFFNRDLGVSSTNRSDFGADDFFAFHAEFYRPLSLKWQWDLVSTVTLFVNKPLRLDGDDINPGYHYSDHRAAAIQSDLRYIYDARTSLLLSATATGSWQEITSYSPVRAGVNELSWNTTDYETRVLAFEVSMQVAYRIAIPTTLRIDWIYSRRTISEWYDRFEREYNTHGFDLSAGITHWLF